MPLTFVPTGRDDVPKLVRFLTSVFGLREDAPFVAKDLIEWKYFASHPHWDGPRSYLLKQDGKLAAHGCAHPANFVTLRGTVTGTRVIDWAAGADVPGAGVLLFRKFASLAATLFAVGGSPETQSILPKIGFRRVGELSLYALPVRPVRQFLRRPKKDARSVARLVRNLAWRRIPPADRAQRFSAVPVEQFECVPEPAPTAEFTRTRRSPELLNHMLACPGAVFRGFVIREGADVRGHFVLSRVAGQTRIVDIRIEGDWQAAFTLAAREAARDPETCEVAAATSVDRLREAILASGFQPRGAEPVFLYDPKRLLADAPPLSLQLLDGDECYLNNPDYPFWS
jgi:hypothetical protein